VSPYSVFTAECNNTVSRLSVCDAGVPWLYSIEFHDNNYTLSSLPSDKEAPMCSRGIITNLQVEHEWYTVWVKKSPPLCNLRFSDIFSQTVEKFKSVFTHLLYVPIYARLQIFIQLSQILTKLCHIKRDYLVHIICSKYPPSAGTHAFRRLRKSLIVCWSLSVASHPRSAAFIMLTNILYMTWRQQWRYMLSKQTYKLSSSET